MNISLKYKQPDLKHKKVNSNFLPWLQLFSKLLENTHKTILFLPLQINKIAAITNGKEGEIKLT